MVRRLVPLALALVFASCAADPSGEAESNASPTDPPVGAPLDGGAGSDAAAPPATPFTPADVNHVLVTGQSNSVGVGGTPPLTTTQPYGNLMFDVGTMTGASCDDQGCKQYQKPTAFVPLVEGDTYYAQKVETLASGFANQATKLARAERGQAAHDVLVSVHGRSGRTYWCLRKTGCDWEGAGYVKAFADGMRQVEDASAIARAKGKSHVVRAVLAVHGESDNDEDEFPLPGTDGAPSAIKSYSDALLEWQRDYQAGVSSRTGQKEPVPLFVSQMSNWAAGLPARIPLQQLDAHVRSGGKVVVVGPTYPFTYNADCLHMDAASERRIGEYFAKAYAAQILGGRAWEPVRPLSIAASGATITVRFAVPKPPLVLDTDRVTDPGSYGFGFSDGSASPPRITKVAVTAPDTVTITLAAAPTGAKRRLTYAMNAAASGSCPGPKKGPRGNLRDSDATPSQYGDELFDWAVHFDLPVP